MIKLKHLWRPLIITFYPPFAILALGMSVIATGRVSPLLAFAALFGVVLAITSYKFRKEASDD